MFFSPNIYKKQTEFFKRFIEISKTDDDFVEGKNFFSRFQNIKYFAHYDVSLKIFQEYPIIGVANKNFRYECHNDKYFDEKIRLTNLRCNTHPHQIHFELLSEHGIVGYIFFIYLMFIGLKNIFYNYTLTKNILYFSTLSYLIVFLVPILPSGSFFNF